MLLLLPQLMFLVRPLCLEEATEGLVGSGIFLFLMVVLLLLTGERALLLLKRF